MPFYKTPPVNAILSNSAATLSDLAVDDNTLTIDETNNRVGIGTATPSGTLGIDGDLYFQPTAISTSHVYTAGSLDIRCQNNLKIGTDGADSIRIGRTNTALAKIYVRSGADNDLVVTDSKVGIGTDSPSTALQVAGVITSTGLTIGSAAITETELEILDGATLTTTELNYVDGVTSAIQTQIDGKQATDADLTALSSCQAGGAAALALLSANEIAILDGAVLTTTELNYVDGVTSAIQTQLDSKGATAGSNSIVTVGALDAGSITSGFGNIDVGSSTIDTTGAVGTGALTVAGDATVTGGDITLGASADANNTAIVAVTEAGTNTNGKTLTIGGGLGTGTGLPGSVTITSGIPGSSGSTAHNSTPVAVFDTYGATLNFGGVAALANDTGIGEKVYFGTEDGTDTLNAGRLMCLDTSGVWKYADADAEATTKTLLAIALGTAVSDGLLIKGYFKLNSFIEGSFGKGQPCFVSEAAGEIDFTSPSASGDFQRVVGYGIDTTNVIYFNPSGSWIEL